MKRSDEIRLAQEWQALQDKHAAQSKFSSRNQNHRTPEKVVSDQLDVTKVMGTSPRAVRNEGLNIKSVPMFGNATIKRDDGLEAAKAVLRSRAAPLYNKGGPQYVGDEDAKDMQSGALRRR